MDDSIANDNLAADDSMDLMIDDGACIQHDSSSNNLKSAGLSDSGIDQDKNSITQDELLEEKIPVTILKMILMMMSLKVKMMSLMMILMRMKMMSLKVRKMSLMMILMRMSQILKMTKGMMNF